MNQPTLIQKWARETFPSQTVKSVLDHLDEEQRELMEALKHDDLEGIADGIADMCILLYALAEVLDLNTHDAIDKKHGVNLERTWKLDPHKGYHKRVEIGSNGA